MRTLLLSAILLFLSTLSTPAQDPSTAAGQAATQAAQQASMQAMQAAQLQMQQQMQAAQEESQRLSQQMTEQMNQNINEANARLSYCCGYAAKPKFSLKAGTYFAPQQVRIRDTTRDAVIYYTTDGWTPTTASKVYTGPITIDSTTTLQAIAVVPGPYPGRSLIASAKYTVNGTSGLQPAKETAPDEPAPETLSASGEPAQNPVPLPPRHATRNYPPPSEYALLEGTRVHLVFAAPVNSKTAEVGDKIPLIVDQEITYEDQVVVPKGALGFATVLHVNRTGPGGAPGDIVFEVQSMNVNGTTVELCGGNAMEGEPKPPNAAFLIPVVGAFTIFRHGKDAEIKAGMPVVAAVYADTVIPVKPKANTPAH